MAKVAEIAEEDGDEDWKEVDDEEEEKVEEEDEGEKEGDDDENPLIETPVDEAARIPLPSPCREIPDSSSLGRGMSQGRSSAEDVEVCPPPPPPPPLGLRTRATRDARVRASAILTIPWRGAASGSRLSRTADGAALPPPVASAGDAAAPSSYAPLASRSAFLYKKKEESLLPDTPMCQCNA